MPSTVELSSIPEPTLHADPLPPPRFEAPPKTAAEVPLIELRSIDIPVTPRDWRDVLNDAVRYPFRQHGLSILGGAALLSAIPFIGPAIAYVLLGYGAPYFFRVIQDTINGGDAPPDWPEPAGYFRGLDAGVLPAAELSIITTLSAAPLLAYHWLVPESARSVWIVLALLVLFALYLPMATLRYVVEEQFMSLMPHRVIPPMLKAGGGYLLLVPMAAIIGGLATIVGTWSDRLSLFGAPLVVLGYVLLVVHGRLLGMFYRYYQHRFDW